MCEVLISSFGLLGLGSSAKNQTVRHKRKRVGSSFKKVLSRTLNNSQFLKIWYDYSAIEKETISEINLSRHLTNRCPEAKREGSTQGMHFVDGILNLGGHGVFHPQHYHSCL